MEPKYKLHYDYVQEAGLEAAEAVFNSLPDIPRKLQNELQNRICCLIEDLCDVYFEIYE